MGSYYNIRSADPHEDLGRWVALPRTRPALESMDLQVGAFPNTFDNSREAWRSWLYRLLQLEEGWRHGIPPSKHPLLTSPDPERGFAIRDFIMENAEGLKPQGFSFSELRNPRFASILGMRRDQLEVLEEIQRFRTMGINQFLHESLLPLHGRPVVPASLEPILQNFGNPIGSDPPGGLPPDLRLEGNNLRTPLPRLDTDPRDLSKISTSRPLHDLAQSWYRIRAAHTDVESPERPVSLGRDRPGHFHPAGIQPDRPQPAPVRDPSLVQGHFPLQGVPQGATPSQVAQARANNHLLTRAFLRAANMAAETRTQSPLDTTVSLLKTINPRDRHIKTAADATPEQHIDRDFETIRIGKEEVKRQHDDIHIKKDKRQLPQDTPASKKAERFTHVLLGHLTRSKISLPDDIKESVNRLQKGGRLSQESISNLIKVILPLAQESGFKPLKADYDPSLTVAQRLKAGQIREHKPFTERDEDGNPYPPPSRSKKSMQAEQRLDKVEKMSRDLDIERLNTKHPDWKKKLKVRRRKTLKLGAQASQSRMQNPADEAIHGIHEEELTELVRRARVSGQMPVGVKRALRMLLRFTGKGGLV